MACSLSTKFANPACRNSVFGFIREFEKQTSSSVPMMLKYLCLDFYFLRDRFGSHGAYIQVQDEGNSASFNVDKNPSDPTSNGTLYGCVPVGAFDNGIIEYRWTLQLVRCSTLFLALAVGLDASDRKWTNGHFCGENNSDRAHIGLEFNNWLRAKKHANPQTVRWEMTAAYERGSFLNSFALKKNDIIGLVLNVSDQTLSFSINQQLFATAKGLCLGDDTKYYLAITVPNGEAVLRMKSFSALHCGQKVI